MNNPAVGIRTSPGSGSPTIIRPPARLPNSSVTPTAPDNAGDELISRVRATLAEVERYLRAAGARRRRLVTVTIVAAAIATLLTASAAFGGKSLTDWLTAIFALSSPSWRILCAIAAACSLTAGVATQLNTSKNYEEHIGRAQIVKATLEMLEISITLNHLSQHEATRDYLRIIENASFMEAGPANRT